MPRSRGPRIYVVQPDEGAMPELVVCTDDEQECEEFGFEGEGEPLPSEEVCRAKTSNCSCGENAVRCNLPALPAIFFGQAYIGNLFKLNQRIAVFFEPPLHIHG